MLYYRKSLPNGSILGVWKVEETIEALEIQLNNKKYLESIYKCEFPFRKRLLLATRCLLKELIGDEKNICYLESHKPFIQDHSYHISISHTSDYVAVILDPQSNVGLDIEQYTNKVMRVAHRFVAEDEQIDKENEQLHLLLHWSAKEALFKYLDPSSVDFVEHFRVSPFAPCHDGGQLEIKESLTTAGKQFTAYYLVFDDFVLVYIK